MKPTNRKSIIFSKNGFSLFEMMIALGVSSIVGYSAVDSFVSSKKQESKVQNNVDLEVAQLQLSQKSRSYRFWQDMINSMPNAVVMQKCLNSVGTNCAANNNTNWVQAYTACAMDSCQLKSEIKYKMICLSDSNCKGIETMAVTTYTPKHDESLASREPAAVSLSNTKQISSFVDGKLLVSASGGFINNTCATVHGQAITDVNADHTIYYCNETNIVQKCSSQLEPLRQISSTSTMDTSSTKCQIPVQQSCPNKGLSGSGGFVNMAKCDVTPAEEPLSAPLPGPAYIAQGPSYSDQPIIPIFTGPTQYPTPNPTPETPTPQLPKKDIPTSPPTIPPRDNPEL